jgi:hypothetical protein
MLYFVTVGREVDSMRLYSLLAACLLIASSLIAQESEEFSRGPDGGTRVHVSGIDILPAAGKPFSGRDSLDWTRTLEDGTVQTTHLEANLARDSQGRIYRESSTWVPANGTQKSRAWRFYILDPTTHTRTVCMIASHSCEITGYHGATTFTARPVGPFDDGKRYLARDSMGNDVIDGIAVVGTREIVTINAGVIGNSQPLAITREFWYSPELQVNLAVTRRDPRQGTQVIHVVDLSRSEPDPAWFKVPGIYLVQDLRQATNQVQK